MWGCEFSDFVGWCSTTWCEGALVVSSSSQVAPDWHSWSVVLENTTWTQMAPIWSQRWGDKDNQATKSHSDNPVMAPFFVWTYCKYGWRRKCQDDPNSSATWELEETIRVPSHRVVEHRPTRSENSQPHIEWSSRAGSGPSSVEADVYAWCYALLEVQPEKTKEKKSATTTPNCYPYLLTLLKLVTVSVFTSSSVRSLNAKAEARRRWMRSFLTFSFSTETKAL